jgi:hypothetical protein
MLARVKTVLYHSFCVINDSGYEGRNPSASLGGLNYKEISKSWKNEGDVEAWLSVRKQKAQKIREYSTIIS